MHQEDDEVVERLREERQKGNAFPLPEKGESRQREHIHHHAHRANDDGREYLFRADIKFRQNDEVEGAKVRAARDGGQNEGGDEIDDVAIDLVAEALDGKEFHGLRNGEHDLDPERRQKSAPAMRFHRYAHLIEEDKDLDDDEQTEKEFFPESLKFPFFSEIGFFEKSHPAEAMLLLRLFFVGKRRCRRNAAPVLLGQCRFFRRSLAGSVCLIVPFIPRELSVRNPVIFISRLRCRRRGAFAFRSPHFQPPSLSRPEPMEKFLLISRIFPLL